jgi:hypothetical protein
MGVSYFTCDGCNICYRDDSDFACYCDCGSNFCNKDCGKLSNYLDPICYQDLDEDNPKYQDYIDEDCHINKDKQITCVICRNELYTNNTLLDSLIKHFNIIKDQVIDIWKGKVK